MSIPTSNLDKIYGEKRIFIKPYEGEEMKELKIVPKSEMKGHHFSSYLIEELILRTERLMKAEDNKSVSGSLYQNKIVGFDPSINKPDQTTVCVLELKPEQLEKIEQEADRISAEMKEVFSPSMPLPAEAILKAIINLSEQTALLRKASKMLDDMERLIKAYSRKPRKTTFKTIRKDCAKRNSNK